VEVFGRSAFAEARLKVIMKDLFSQHASHYAQFRPVYPEALYQFIFSQVKNFNCAWDAGTGNGQAAHVLAKQFKKIFATDISSAQLEHAPKADNIFYSISAEELDQPDSSIDMVTVAQAIHWFDIEKFFKCVARVGTPDAVLTVWGYGLLQVNPVVDSHINHFYKNVVGPYWDPERKLIDEHYQTISFPFQEIKTPPFSFSFWWSLAQLEGYLNTWSAVRKYISNNQVNPVDELITQLKPLWQNQLEVTFPLFLRIGRMK
jgi:SAM-dependent methyltransferase